MAIYPRNTRQSGSPVSNWVGIAIMAVVLIGLFVVLRGIFNLLYFLAPVMLIATLIIDYKVVLRYIKQLGGLFTTNPIYGIGATALTFFFYPVIFLVLLFRAITGRRLKQFEGESIDREDDYVDYEELDSEPLDLDEFGKIKVKKDEYRQR
jgi:hypothetical protein